MNKKVLLVAPAVAFGIAGLVSCGDSLAVGTDGITTGDVLRDCLQDVAQEYCSLGGDVTLDATKEHHSSMGGWDSYSNLSVDIINGHKVVLDLNGYNVTAKIPINIEDGSLTVANNSGTLNFTETRSLRTGWSSSEEVKPQFRMVGSSDATKTEYSVLNLNAGIQITSTENEAIRVSTGADGNSGYPSYRSYDRSYGTIVNLRGVDINAPKAIVVDDYNGSGRHGEKADNAPIINIGNGTTITATDDALVSNVFSNWIIDDATIESEDNVISMSNGEFTIQDSESKLSTEGEGAAVINVKEGASTNEASIVIDDGVFQSTGENGVFYQEPNFVGGSNKTIGSIEINGGVFTASDLFNTESRFDEAHEGFIEGGTWGPKWDEEDDNDYVASGYLKNFDTSLDEDSNIMTVTEPSVEGLPEGYTLDLSRRIADDAEGLKAILEKAGVQGTALNQYIEVYLFDETGAPVSELPEESDGITLRIGGFEGIPELKDGASRKYYVVSIHSGEGEDPEISAIETVYDEETGEITFPNLTKFSDFVVAYADTEIPAPVPEPTPEEEEAPATPETGAGTAQAGGIVSSTLILCALIGLTVSAFTYFKLFRKR